MIELKNLDNDANLGAFINKKEHLRVSPMISCPMQVILFVVTTENRIRSVCLVKFVHVRKMKAIIDYLCTSAVPYN